MDHATHDNAQTPAQWAVRWHGVVAAALLVLSVPVFHLTWHGALGRDEPPIRTRSQVAMPEATAAAVLDGTWMEKADRHLRESSPIVWRLRGTWNETLLRCGVVQNRLVHLGAERWLFHRSTVRPNAARFRREAGPRRRFFERLRDVVRSSGAELVVSLVPDKARVYPDFAYADGELPARKRPLYGAALQELRDAGIPAVDIAAALAAARAAAPAQPLYYARDTHWRPEGALAAAQAVAAVVQALPAAAGLLPRRTAELGARTTVSSLGDLTSMLGLLTREVEMGEGRTRTQPLSLLSSELAENRDYYSVVMRAGGVAVEPLPDDPETEILLIGTSFSEANGAGALALALGRPVRAVIDYGASGLAALGEVRDELRAGTKAKVVVWEIVERGLLEADWDSLKL